MIPLAEPNISGRESEYLLKCVETNHISSIGEFVTQLEEMTAEVTGAEACAATSSGTTGLHAALIGIGVQPGDLVIVPSFTFIASANAIAHCHASPWFIDIQKESWCIDPLEIERNIYEHTYVQDSALIHKNTGRRVSAVMPVYTLGTIADMGRIREICGKYNLPIVADAAAAIGATYQGNELASLAELSVISFNGNKTVTAGGGGAVVGNKRIIEHIKHITTTARIGKAYEHDQVGFNYRMTNLQAAVGCAQMDRMREFVEVKRQIRRKYNEFIDSNSKIGKFPEPNWSSSSCWLSGLTLTQCNEIDSVALTAKLNSLGIGARTFWKPAHMQAPYIRMPKGRMKVTEDTWSRIVTLPCSTSLPVESQAYVIEQIARILGGD